MNRVRNVLCCFVWILCVACGSNETQFASKDSQKGAQLLAQYEEGSQRVKEMSTPGYWKDKGNQIDPVKEITKANDELDAVLDELGKLIKTHQLSKEQYETFKEITGVNELLNE